jgi:hypothetical protein
MSGLSQPCMTASPAPHGAQGSSTPSPLLERLRQALLSRHVAPPQAEAYASSVEAFIRFHGLETTMIYTHVARKGSAGLSCPLDFLCELTAESIEAAAVAGRQLRRAPPADAGPCACGKTLETAPAGTT